MKLILGGVGAIVFGTLICVAYPIAIGFPIMVVTGNFNPHGAGNGLLCLLAFIGSLALVITSIGRN